MLVVPVAVVLGAGAGGLEPSLRVLGPLSTFGLPVVAMIAFWWEDWPGTRLKAPLSGLLDTVLTPELRLEGLARDVVRGIQELRKRSGFSVDDRIAIFYQGDGLPAEALERWRDYIAAETLAVTMSREPAPAGSFEKTLELDGHPLRVSVMKASPR